jgi:hypothetical protein
MRSLISIFGRPTYSLVLVICLTVVVLAGCGGGGGEAPAASRAHGSSPGYPAEIPNFHSPEQWIELIDDAGSVNSAFYEYADLGRRLLADGAVKFVSPPTLGEQFNAFCWIDTEEIWINEPMFARYPDVVEQASIFLHEMIHIKTGEVTHDGPCWSLPNEFESYCRNGAD